MVASAFASATKTGRSFSVASAKSSAIVVRGVVAVVAVAKPAFDRLRLYQPVLGSVAEEVLEGEAIRLPVAGEEGGEALAQQLAALLPGPARTP